MPTATATAAPILRWAGGKRRLLPALRAARPATFGDYHEPFFGGGAFFFDLRVPGPRAHLNDLTRDLATTYTVLRDQPEDLIGALERLAEDTSKDAYLATRASDPSTDLARAARFVYLNRTCFNGLYRVNSRGQFNVPYGQLKNPTVCDAPLLRAASVALAGADITNLPYEQATAAARPGDLVYLDPPYLPLSTSSSFSAYTKDGFSLADHEALADHVQELTSRGVHVMLSNADTADARRIFDRLHLHTVGVTRSIAAKDSARGRVTEILATSYPPSAMSDPAALTALR